MNKNKYMILQRSNDNAHGRDRYCKVGDMETDDVLEIVEKLDGIVKGYANIFFIIRE